MNVVLSIEAVRPPLAGIGRYVWELATRLPQHPEIESMRFLSDGIWRDLPKLNTAGDVATTANLKLDFSSSVRHKLGKIALISAVYGKWMPMLAARQLDQVEDGIFHGPNFFVPQTDLPSVVTIHDLSAYHFPEWHPKTRFDRMRKMIPQAIDRASVVLTDSEATKIEIVQEFGIRPDKVHAISLGVDPIYHPRSAETLVPVLARFGLTVSGYSFFVSTIEPRKNLLNLIAAYRLLPLEMRQRWPLVLVGGEGWNSAAIHREIEVGVSEGWLKYLGFVAQEFLPMLYAGCRLFTYPSLYEGFGLPIAEAMASGVPVLTSNCSSMPEVAAGCACLVEPSDVDAIRTGLKVALEDEPWRSEAILKGLQRSSQLTWDACIQRTVNAYQIALASR